MPLRVSHYLQSKNMAFIELVLFYRFTDRRWGVPPVLWWHQSTGLSLPIATTEQIPV